MTAFPKSILTKMTMTKMTWIRQTSKDMGVNVEGDLEAEEIVHTFALSKDENKSNDENIVLTI